MSASKQFHAILTTFYVTDFLHLPARPHRPLLAVDRAVYTYMVDRFVEALKAPSSYGKPEAATGRIRIDVCGRCSQERAVFPLWAFPSETEIRQGISNKPSVYAWLCRAPGCGGEDVAEEPLQEWIAPGPLRRMRGLRFSRA